MFFPECEAIVSNHRDLLAVVQKVDHRLSGITGPAILRPGDFSSALGAEKNQVASVFDLLAAGGVLQAEEMVECDRCQNLMRAKAFRRAIEDEDEFVCTACSRPFRANSQPILVYRMTADTLVRTRAEAQLQAAKHRRELDSLLGAEPLADRAQLALTAMLELGATDSDRRQSAEAIAAKALGPGADPNALKGVMADLRTRKLTESKTGRTGGAWLTEAGRKRAEKLRN